MVTNKNGQGLLHIVATKKGVRLWNEKGESTEVGVFRYLMERGLDAMAEDEESRSALDVVVASASAGILHIFQRDKC